ncbi:bactofilin family protein [Parafilimonas sp.]|uniref:bactofilin family protein n=1 Tax=Parafilimonas sp. TaxID=1969739 RepID=UPI0039E360C3
MKALFLHWRTFYISKNTTINGNISAEDDGKIAGTVNGDIIANNTLTIGRNGILNGNAYAKKIVVKGMVKGNLYCEEKVYAHKNAEVHGNIFAREAIIHKGSIIKGAISQVHQKADAPENAAAGKKEEPPETNMAVIAARLTPEEPPQTWF